MSNELQPILIAGEWRDSVGVGSFHAINPKTRESLPEGFPVSPWTEVEEVINAAAEAFEQLLEVSPEVIAKFLENYADRIEARGDELTERAHTETALPAEPRLRSVELPRTSNQLRQAATAARERSWAIPTIDTVNDIRSLCRAIGPVCVFGPNNFPFAFNSVAGGDFAAAIAAGNPVIAKAHTSHPATSRILAEEASAAVSESGLPAGTIQMIYRTSHADGARLVSHPLIGATGYTGSRRAGLALKEAADEAGVPIYLELSSINPVVLLPGALDGDSDRVVDDFVTSVLMGTGQFCTNPGLVVLFDDDSSASFIEKVKVRFEEAPPGTLLSEGVENSLRSGIQALQDAGAEKITDEREGGEGYCVANTLLRVDAKQFLQNSIALQEEAFGNSSLLVVVSDRGQMRDILHSLEGNLTGCIYSDSGGGDDAIYAEIEPILRRKVGRILNDKMPTGVAVSPAMNHGGPYPATGHPGFTSVGIPASLLRFSVLQSYDNVRQDRLPQELADKNPTGKTWRLVDGNWTQGDVP